VNCGAVQDSSLDKDNDFPFAMGGRAKDRPQLGVEYGSLVAGCPPKAGNRRLGTVVPKRLWLFNIPY